VRRQFLESLEREGQEVKDHAGTVYRVLFRRSRDRNATADYMTLYHSADSGIEPGETLELAGRKILLVLNTENVESADYRRSDAVISNAFIDLCYSERKENDRHDIVTVYTTYATKIPVFMTSGVTARTLSDLSPDDLEFLLPARYGISTNNSIQMTVLAENSKNHTFKQGTQTCNPTAIDYSLLKIGQDGSFYGILTVRAKIAT